MFEPDRDDPWIASQRTTLLGSDPPEFTLMTVQFEGKVTARPFALIGPFNIAPPFYAIATEKGKLFSWIDQLNVSFHPPISAQEMKAQAKVRLFARSTAKSSVAVTTYPSFFVGQAVSYMNVSVEGSHSMETSAFAAGTYEGPVVDEKPISGWTLLFERDVKFLGRPMGDVWALASGWDNFDGQIFPATYFLDDGAYSFAFGAVSAAGNPFLPTASATGLTEVRLAIEFTDFNY